MPIRRGIKRNAGSGDAPHQIPLTSNGAIGSSNVKFRIINSNLKFAINNCRNSLEAELRKTNMAMKEKIHEWLSKDPMGIFRNNSNTDSPLAKENEALRQLLSELVNGPLVSLFPNDERKKLVKLVIPTLPPVNVPFFEERKEVDFYQGYDSQTSLYAISPEVSVESVRTLHIDDLFSDTEPHSNVTKVRSTDTVANKDGLSTEKS